jgi:hypothetical protein
MIPEGISPQDPRLDPNYYAYYYSQRPPNPRLPPPLFNPAAWQPQQQRGNWVGPYKTQPGKDVQPGQENGDDAKVPHHRQRLSLFFFFLSSFFSFRLKLFCNRKLSVSWNFFFA